MIEGLSYELRDYISTRADGTFVRLHKLVNKGYVPVFDNGVEDAIWLNHPGGAPSLILYSEGMIVSLDKDRDINPRAEGGDRDHICNEPTDAAAFDHFLASVPKPTWRERTRADREKYIWVPLTGLGCLGLWFVLTALIGRIFKWLGTAIWGF